MKKKPRTKNQQPTTLSFWHPAHLIATCFGVGNIPFAPGTWGSLATLLLFYGIYPLLDRIVFAPLLYILFLPLVFFVGVWVSRVYMQRTGTHDPRAIVIDEVAGQWLTCLLCAPLVYLSMLYTGPGSEERLIVYLFVAGPFFAFRFFDILKFWPASYFDKKVTNEWGVMLDDIAAAIQTTLVMYLLGWAILIGSVHGWSI